MVSVGTSASRQDLCLPLTLAQWRAISVPHTENRQGCTEGLQRALVTVSAGLSLLHLLGPLNLENALARGGCQWQGWGSGVTGSVCRGPWGCRVIPEESASAQTASPRPLSWVPVERSRMGYFARVLISESCTFVAVCSFLLDGGGDCCNHLWEPHVSCGLHLDCTSQPSQEQFFKSF